MDEHTGSISVTYWLLILAAVLCPLSVYGASFDCSKASTDVEKMICSDDQLSGLDSNLAVLYKKALSESKNPQDIKAKQKQWITDVRNKCTTIRCLKASYAKRLHELKPSEAAAENLERPVRMEDLGENWKYKRDADKVPVIRKAMARGNLIPNRFDSGAMCKTFPADFLAGKFEAIEPDFQVLSFYDPRLGIPAYEKGGIERPRDDPRLLWHRCDLIKPTPSQDANPDTFFDGLQIGIPPYRFYHIQLNNTDKSGPQDIAIYRERGNGYSHDYIWVDLKNCEINNEIHVGSPKDWIYPNRRDALSLLIRYQGRVVVLEMADYSSLNSADIKASISVNSFLPHEHCTWDDPRLLTHKSKITK